MRPITKIFLLAVAAFVVYLLWPHKPDLRSFKPSALADLEVKSWVADKRGKGIEALIERYKIYNTEYGFSPVSSMQIARVQRAGIDALRDYMPDSQNPDPAAENRVLAAFREKFGRIKREIGSDLDPDILAREELAWRSLEMGGSSVNEIAVPMSRVFAGLYGGDEADYVDVAVDWATARSYIYSGDLPSDGSDPVQNAKMTLREGLSLLQEIVNPGAAPSDE